MFSQRGTNLRTGVVPSDKSVIYGKTLHLIDRFFPSLKMCSQCGHIHVELTLTDRTYVCKICEMVKDHDLNAAINLNTVGKAHPEPTDACGHDGSVSRSDVTETTSMNEAGSERGAMIYYCTLLAEQEWR